MQILYLLTLATRTMDTLKHYVDSVPVVRIIAYFPHSLRGNSVGDEGAVAIAKAVKKMNNLQKLV